ncbi:MAG: hypothetical protein K2G69_08075 [Muribaculaceae bacterium]|nr:hypothetical protein [Muribaculaceae bacterium]
MRRLILSLILGFISLMTVPVYSTSTGDREPVETWLTEADSEEEERDEIPINPPAKGRIPSQPHHCHIGQTGGIVIGGVDSSEILSFEIRDTYGNTVAILADEASFIETLFSLSGEYRLIFRLPGRTLAGWINI